MLWLVAILAFYIALAWFDIRTRRLPNPLIIGLAGLALAHGIFTVGLPAMLWHGAAALIVLLIGMIAYQNHWLGAGDVKLISVSVFWLGISMIAPFFTIMALLGGILALVMLVWSARHFFNRNGLKQMLRSRTVRPRNITLPYGVAIAGSAALCGVQLYPF